MSLKITVKLPTIPRRVDASARLVRLMLAARFLDEWWGGLIFVLMPIIRDDLGLSYAQVSVLLASFVWAGWVADPAAGLIGDVWPRGPVIAASAGLMAIVLLVLTGSASFEMMLVICVAYSLLSTPIATIADAVLVDGHPGAEGRIVARQTFFDTVGALLAPLTATVLAALGLTWPLAFGVGAVMFLGYGLLLWRTRFPSNGLVHDAPEAAGGSLGLGAMWRNLKTVSTLPDVWRWLFFLAFGDFLSDIFRGFMPLFLADAVGLDAAWVGVFMAVDLAVGLAVLGLLEPVLARWGEDRTLRLGVVGAGLLFPLWVLNRDPVLALLLLIPLAAAVSVLWPLGKTRLLAASQGRTATVTALTPLSSLPANLVPLLVGAIAEVAGLPLGVMVLAAAPPLMLALMGRRRVPEHAVEIIS